MKQKLSTFYLAFFILLSLNGLSQNMLTEGDFDATTDIEICDENTPAAWCEFTVDNTNSDATVVDGECNIHVSNPGDQNWEVQLIQVGFNLEAGHAYNLSFDIKADKAASFGVFIGENGGNWTNLVGDRYWQEATTEWQHISLDFISPFNFLAYKFSFEFGQLDNTTMFIDNVSLIDMEMYSANIGIIGDAVFGWEGGDAFMETTDEVIYTLREFPLSAGALKFRQDGDWAVNWGPPWDQPPAFPHGMGVSNGQNIRIPAAGNYDIMFNRINGEYHFTCVSNCAVEIGITGTAVPPFFNWDDNYKLGSPDGENYHKLIRYFGDGEVKFRQLDNWDNTWGGTELQGTAVPGGEAITIAEGFYNVHFNISTLDYQFRYPFVGMVGNALNGWEDDIEMGTMDGFHYTLADQYFHQGETKFRIEHNWAINFGTYWEEPFGGFPAGPAIRNEMNIIVPAGIYTVNLDLQTRVYNFEGTPCLNCPGDIHVASAPDWCGAIVDYPELFVDEMCGTGFTVEQVEGLPSGSEFPLGETHQVFIAHNDQGEFMECHFNVIVEDVPPMVPFFEAEYIMPWPPNHEMIPVTLHYELSDNCSPEVMSLLRIWHSEENLEKGEGKTRPDWEILDDHHVLVRAERSGQGAGREYHIVLSAIDQNWNINEQEVLVFVDHDRGKSMEKSVQFECGSYEGMLKADVCPNPSKTSFQLNLSSTPEDGTEIILYNVNGQVVFRKEIQNQTQTFGENLSSGVYLLRLHSETQNRIFKIVKE